MTTSSPDRDVLALLPEAPITLSYDMRTGAQTTCSGPRKST